MPWTPISGHWYAVPEHWPVDGLTVWTRRWPGLAAPFQTTFSLANHDFTTVLGGLVIPWLWIVSWKQP
jgi:hypothetical protein